MNQSKLHATAAGLVVLSFILIVWGLGVADWIWLAGLGCAALAQGFALAVHWAPSKEDGQQEQQGQMEQKANREKKKAEKERHEPE